MIQSNTTFHPSLDDFTAQLAAGKSQLVWTRVVSDLETPVSAMLKLMDKSKPAFLLESVEGGEVRGRYSIIGLEPDLMWRSVGGRSEISRTPPFHENSFEPCWEDSLSSLRAQVKSIQMDMPEEIPSAASGLIGYMAYDMVKQMERLPDANPDTTNIPDACFMRPGLMLVFDSVDGVIYLATPVWAEGSDASQTEALYNKACQRIDDTMRTLQGPIDQRNYFTDRETPPIDFTSNMSKDDYFAMVEKAKEYIVAGDIFQVVPSQRFSADFDLHPLALYRSLRHMNPSPFLFFLHYGDYSLIGSSPEILVRLRDNKVTIRPIAGTRKRGSNRAEDAALAEDLLNDPKEKAEHLMLLDLGRNDVGRVAKPGTVEVTQEMIIEHYSHVMHIVSNVEGELDPAHDAIDALVGGFPAGTVSGAPKIRAMEIIDELEPTRRSFYAGCVGYFSSDGSMDTCIMLRTGLMKDGKLHVQAGGGVVADSDPQAEYDESVNKAQAVMRAAEQAIKFI